MRDPCIFSFLTLIGTVSVTEDGEGRITGVYLPNGNLPAMDERETDILDEASGQLNEYFSGRRKRFDLPLAYESTPFRTAVMDAVREIPYGEIRTYSQLAKAAGSPNAFRAAGSVCASNPLPILIPCHRVVPSSGGIGRYAYGTSMKRRLLELEREHS